MSHFPSVRAVPSRPPPPLLSPCPALLRAGRRPAAVVLAAVDLGGGRGCVVSRRPTRLGMPRCARHRRGDSLVCELGEALGRRPARSEEHTSELQSHSDLVCRLLLEKKKQARTISTST